AVRPRLPRPEPRSLGGCQGLSRAAERHAAHVERRRPRGRAGRVRGRLLDARPLEPGQPAAHGRRRPAGAAVPAGRDGSRRLHPLLVPQPACLLRRGRRSAVRGQRGARERAAPRRSRGTLGPAAARGVDQRRRAGRRSRRRSRHAVRRRHARRNAAGRAARLVRSSRVVGGFNYEASDRHAFFGHLTRSAKLPHFDDLRNGIRREDRVTNVEIGYKAALDRLALFLAAYGTSFDNVPFTDILADGSTVVRRAETRTLGVELEGVYEPIDAVSFEFSATLQEPEYRNFRGTGIDNSGNRVRRIPRVMVRVIPSLSFAEGRGRAWLM